MSVELNIKDLFDEEYTMFQRETGGSSIIQRNLNNIHYHKLLDFGTEAIPWWLEKLQANRYNHAILPALRTLTKENPAKDLKTVDEAIAAWIKWGKENEYIK